MSAGLEIPETWNVAYRDLISTFINLQSWIRPKGNTQVHGKRILFTTMLPAVLAMVVTACTSDAGSPRAGQAIDQTSESPTEQIPTQSGGAVDPSVEGVAAPAAPALLPAEDPPRGAEQQFSTDFGRHTIPYSEILSGGPPKDGIPAIDDPQFVEISDADAWLDDQEPVSVVEHKGDTRIYPFQIMMWHEIVNDVVGGEPVAITFCPLCNTAIVFDASVDGTSLDFGTTGRLRFSNLLMYDRQTESWWQQATGEAVIGELTGTQLDFLPTSVISWSEAKENFPGAKVLSRDTGYSRDYGRNPYVGYDDINRSPFLFSGPITPGQLPPMARVTTVELNEEAVAYPNDVLAELVVVNDTVGGVDVVVMWQPGLASALDSSSLAAGQDVGANGIFEREIDGQTLTFAADGDVITDEQTGSTWNVLGQATSGELSGQELTPVVKVDHFWFSWAAFQPDTRIYQP